MQFMTFEVLKKQRQKHLAAKTGRKESKRGKDLVNDLWMGAVSTKRPT
jgi:hypothetical protein